MLDRTKTPAIHRIQDLVLPQPKVHHLDNGIEVYETHLGTQEVIKLELVYRAGRPWEQKRLAGRATAALIREGTAQKHSEQVAETIDFYGGTLSIPVNLDTSNISLYCLAKHFESLLPLVAELVTKPAFRPGELKNFIERNVRSLEVDLTRNDVVAYRMITEKMYGSDHPYGYNSNGDLFRQLKPLDLRTHFDRTYRAENCTIFISGWTNERTISLLNTYLGKRIPNGQALQPDYSAPKELPSKVFTEELSGVQTAIRVGRRLFNRQHPDYAGWYFLNTVLGGYFGSRLMANIREEKGLTYNIYSTLDPMLFDGYFYVGTEVANEQVYLALREIYREIEVLRNEVVGEEELEMVRNYLLGNLLTLLDGAFNVGDIVKMIVLDQLPMTYFDDLVKTIQTMDGTKLKALAQQYLQKEHLWEVVVGNSL
ncbi:MAG: pitrilysin family protein [Bacteroidota bacterium]